MSEVNRGTCQYCGQSRIVETVGEVSQAERDAMATDQCFCPEAKEARRKAEREKKKTKYLEEKFKGSPAKEFMAHCIEAVDKWDSGIEYVQVKLDNGWTHKVYLNKDSDLKIKITKKNEEETTI